MTVAKPAVTAASAPRRSSSRSSESLTSMTPLSASNPSKVGGDASIFGASCFIVARTASSTAELMRTTGTAPLRSTVRLACTDPRVSACAARARTGTSIASQPGGKRSRRSSPLPLTDLISQAQL